ncbi:hypothetical protein [Streptomyces sp. NPDC102462]|uniref:hypothetical protein n=1 Tax=Streptomyces sp. NPDC102462 TaxID=3366178 RepID=UPI00380C0E60
MNTRAVNAAAGVITAALQQGRQTPAGIAIALDSAQLLQSPETAAELARLRAEREKYVLVPKWEYELMERQRERAAHAEARLAEYERPADEDPIAYALTSKADAAADRLTRLFAPTQVLRAELDGERP